MKVKLKPFDVFFSFDMDVSVKGPLIETTIFIHKSPNILRFIVNLQFKMWNTSSWNGTMGQQSYQRLTIYYHIKRIKVQVSATTLFIATCAILHCTELCGKHSKA